MRALAFVGMVLFAGSILAADKEKPLTAAQKKAVAKYDHLPDKWRDKAVEAWKNHLESSKAKSVVMKNEPPYYPNILDHSIKSSSWGTLGRGATPKITVFQIVSKTKMLCKHGDTIYFVDGVSTEKLSDGSVASVKGLFYVDGNESYETAIGGTKTAFVIKPIPEKEANQK